MFKKKCTSEAHLCKGASKHKENSTVRYSLSLIATLSKSALVHKTETVYCKRLPNKYGTNERYLYNILLTSLKKCFFF